VSPGRIAEFTRATVDHDCDHDCPVFESLPDFDM
jgi:hypothetical protein